MTTSIKNRSPPHSPRNSSNRLWVQEQQKRIFLFHLAQWSLNHDSSLHFHGNISVSSQGTNELELGKPIKCVLTDAAFTDARQNIIIKLFLPQEYSTKPGQHEERDTRRDSMDALYCEVTHARDGKDDVRQVAKHGGYYKLVVRCGAGWMSAREYFSKVYISRLRRRNQEGRAVMDKCLTNRSLALGPPPSDKDSVTIRPLFHPFLRLPAELQELILKTAAGLSRTYNLCPEDQKISKAKNIQPPSAIPLGTLFRISKEITKNLSPHMYHSTDFHFGLIGFTSFLWQSGPANRREIRRLTFHFGRSAALHCLRWLAPDPIFSLFEPPVATSPRSLQYFWRCQIQDLVKDVDLFTITIDIKDVSRMHIPFTTAVMQRAFNSVERVRFVETDKNGVRTILSMDDTRLDCLKKERTWRELCLAYYHNHRNHYFYFKDELTKHPEGWEELESIMDRDKEFFDTRFLPLSSGETFSRWK
ncbi:hypothetical protein GQ44DRAFT_619275 [Phaeosphaeriaceae sp. PMI808]|nr:hypothetical protein GQ44DRAFT_619275 [Phaeosphaeriaceae sp. PMI808]